MLNDVLVKGGGRKPWKYIEAVTVEEVGGWGC